MAEEELVEPFEEEKLVGGCISKKIWDRICANAPNFENATLAEIKARLDPNFVPEGWLDPPTPPKKKLKLSLNRKKTASTSELSALKASRFAAPVSEEEVKEAAKGVVLSVAHDQSLHLICAQYPNCTCIYLICAQFLHCTLLYNVYSALLSQTVLYFPNWM